MARLTKRTVETLQTAQSDFLVFDSELRGFGVRVFPSGRKSFLVQYRNGGRTRRIKIGTFGALTADEARQQAKQLLGQVAKGENPAQDIHDRRRAATVSEICDRFLDEHVAVRCKPVTAVEYRRVIVQRIKPAFGSHRIVDITRADVSELHHKLRDIPYMANRVLAVLSKMFNLAEIWGMRPDGSNPCRHVKKYPEKKRERFLSELELQRLGATLHELEASGEELPSAINAIRLLIVTGCRLNEIKTLKWEYIDGGYINLPDSKTGARSIAIGPAVKDVLEGIERYPDNPYVIAGAVAGKCLHNMQKPWRRIRDRAGLPEVRIHDLRHTFASRALANGIDIPTVGKLLGHTQLQTTMRYAHLADEAVRSASDLVGGNLGALIGGGASLRTGTQGNVVPFAR